MTHLGNPANMKPVESPTGYKEYLPDSILSEYNYETGESFNKKYWVDTLLHEGVYRSDGYFFSVSYKYNFTNRNNEMELEYHNIAAIFNNFIFRRIK